MQGDAINDIYFPLDCIVSGVAIMNDGATVEVGMTGREGVVGIVAVSLEERTALYMNALNDLLNRLRALESISEMEEETQRTLRLQELLRHELHLMVIDNVIRQSVRGERSDPRSHTNRHERTAPEGFASVRVMRVDSFSVSL